MCAKRTIFPAHPRFGVDNGTKLHLIGKRFLAQNMSSGQVDRIIRPAGLQDFKGLVPGQDFPGKNILHQIFDRLPMFHEMTPAKGFHVMDASDYPVWTVACQPARTAG
ncbi:MAG: hypothetical protein P8Y73_11685 [Desulfuromonadales bacterium]